MHKTLYGRTGFQKFKIIVSRLRTVLFTRLFVLFLMFLFLKTHVFYMCLIVFNCLIVQLLILYVLYVFKHMCFGNICV